VSEGPRRPPESEPGHRRPPESEPPNNILEDTEDEDNQDPSTDAETNAGGSSGIKEVLHEITREKRERKATKADGADVPECLWEEHLLKDCPTPWVLEERTRLVRHGIKLLPKCMLTWWKRKVTTSFLDWVREQHTELPKTNAKCGKLVEFNGNTYRWAKAKCQVGLPEYKRWWSE
jgi:hypothetical protein